MSNNEIKLNPSERAEFYKVMGNNMTVKIATIYSNEYLIYAIENDALISGISDITKVDAIVGLIFNNQTNALTSICYMKEIEIEEPIKPEDIDI